MHESTQPSEGDSLRVSDGRTHLVLSATAKGAAFSLSYGTEGRNLLSPQPDLWAVETPDGRTVRSSQADAFSWQEVNGDIVLLWEFHEGAWQVSVRLEPQDEEQGIAAWWSASSAGDLRLGEIHFPRLLASETLEKVTAPALIDSSGEMLEDSFRPASERLGGLYPSGFATYQCYAAWGGGPDGLYVGAHDAEAFAKSLVWDAGDLTFTFHQPDPDIPRTHFEIPYPLVIAAFAGDWQDGMDYYRDWAHRSAPWCHRGRLSETGPEWASKSTAWIYSMGNIPLPLEELAPRLREVFGIRGPVGIHSLSPQVQDHSNMPEGEPPSWLREMRTRQAQVLKKHEFYLFEYRNTHKYTKGFVGLESALPYAVRVQGCLREEGPYAGGAGHRSRFVPAGTPGSVTEGAGVDAYGVRTEWEDYLLTEMCMGTPFWRDRLLNAIMPLPSCGLVGVYLDQVPHNLNDSRCDAVAHGHPLRGGNWYIRGHEEVIHRILRHFRLMGVERPLVSHEYISEPLLGLVNTALLDWDIRILSYLYHPFVYFESHTPYNGAPDLDTLQWWLARDFHSGRMPTFDIPCKLPGVEDVAAVLKDLKNPAEEPAFRFIRHWMGLRSAWLEYLNLGTMLHTPHVSPESDAILASAWRSPDDRVVCFVSNLGPVPRKVSVELSVYSPNLEWRVWRNEREPLPFATECELGAGDTVAWEEQGEKEGI